MMGSVIINSSGSIIMKVKVWLTIIAVVGIWMSGCSKSKSLSPEDTALIKGTDRGNFVSVTGVSADQEDEFSPIGDQINGANGSDGLAPQDPFWSDDTLSQGKRPFEPIFFGFDQYNIGADERTKLQDVASYLSNNPGSKILIEGYCDWKGTPAYNKSLGDRRASSVKQYLVDLGSDSSRIEILSMGDELATPNADSTTSALERKAHFVVLGDS
jgi:peptidoglycan-associated lipoprotein